MWLWLENREERAQAHSLELVLLHVCVRVESKCPLLLPSFLPSSLHSLVLPSHPFRSIPFHSHPHSSFLSLPHSSPRPTTAHHATILFTHDECIASSNTIPCSSTASHTHSSAHHHNRSRSMHLQLNYPPSSTIFSCHSDSAIATCGTHPSLRLLHLLPFLIQRAAVCCQCERFKLFIQCTEA